MLFNTFQFAFFFSVIWLLYRVLPSARRIGLLIVASLLFYSLWIPSYLILLLVDIIVNYALLRAMLRSPRPRLYLAAAVLFTLGLLGWFKYAAFLVTSLLPLSQGLFDWSPPVPEVMLPLGISFFSFQILSLTIDRYRLPEEPAPSFSRYLLYVSFFPQLIAGPILRGTELLPQIARGGRISPARTRRGFWLIASGIAKKVILADFLLAPFVDMVFADPSVGSPPVHLIAAYSFAFQIYFDFSGYTDIARGLALLLGFELPLNFMEPYLSRNPAELWRRWHLTLSRWLRDYLYISLGGNRRGRGRGYLNVFLTMLLGGLWHGAGWNFLVWGGLHGLLLAAHRLVARGPVDENAPLSLRDAPKIFLMFHAWCLFLVLFRAASFDDGLVFLTQLFTGSYAAHWPLLPSVVALLCFGLHLAERWLRLHLAVLQLAVAERPWGGVVEGLAFGGIAALAVATSGVGGEFIYFQF
jgi:alginate O-acetyltransferase complex protein AlgI